MGYFEPQTVVRLVDVLNSVCQKLNDVGKPVSAEMKEQIAKRLVASYDAGIMDPEVLKADALTIVPEGAELVSQAGIGRHAR